MFSFTLFSQSNNDKARAYFIDAKSNYDKGNYSQTIENLNLTENLLGATNPMILNLKVKTYYALKDFENAKKSLDAFSKKRDSKTSPSLVEETLSYVIRIDKGIQDEIEKNKELNLLKTKELNEKNEFLEYHKQKLGESNENTIYVKKDDYGNEKWGVVSSDFKVLIDYKFDKLFEEGDGVYFSEVKRNDKSIFGLIDVKKGEELIVPMLERFESFENGSSEVKIDDKWVLIDRNGEEISLRSDNYFKFINGYTVVTLNKKQGVINRNGKTVITPKYNTVVLYKEGFVKVSINKNKNITYNRKTYNENVRVSGLLNMDGEVVIPINQIHGSFKIYGDVVVAEIDPWIDAFGAFNRKYGLFSTNGTLLRSYSSNEIGEFVDGMATIKIKGKLGFINEAGILAVPCKYYSVYPFNNGKAKVSKKGNGKWIIVNKQGEVIN